MLVLTWTRSIYRVLSADASPTAIALGIAFGVMLGLVPLISGLGLLFIAAMIVFRVQLSSALVAMTFSKSLLLLGLGDVFTHVGAAALEPEPLRPFWTWFLNLPVVAWLDLDRLAVTGGLLVGLGLGVLLFWPVRQLVVSYRRCVHQQISQNRFFTLMTNFWFIKALRFVFLGTKAVS